MNKTKNDDWIFWMVIAGVALGIFIVAKFTGIDVNSESFGDGIGIYTFILAALACSYMSWAIYTDDKDEVKTVH